MIITVTLNPSLDRTVELEALVRGEVMRATASHVDPGGKGVNVTRALLANGVASRAVLPCGGEEGQHLVRLLQAEGVDPICVWIAGHTRSNLTLAEPDGTVTKINEPGPVLSPAEFDAVLDEMLVAAVGPDQPRRLGGGLRQHAAGRAGRGGHPAVRGAGRGRRPARGRHQRTGPARRPRPPAPPWSSPTGTSWPRWSDAS